jgi:hypothetical protein
MSHYQPYMERAGSKAMQSQELVRLDNNNQAATPAHCTVSK